MIFRCQKCGFMNKPETNEGNFSIGWFLTLTIITMGLYMVIAIMISAMNGATQGFNSTYHGLSCKKCGARMPH